MLVCRVESPRADVAGEDDVWVSPPYDEGEWFESSVSTEFPRERVLGTDRKPCGWPVHLDVGDEMLWGEVGRLSLLSKEGVRRSSEGDGCCVDW